MFESLLKRSSKNSLPPAQMVPADIQEVLVQAEGTQQRNFRSLAPAANEGTAFPMISEGYMDASVVAQEEQERRERNSNTPLFDRHRPVALADTAAATLNGTVKESTPMASGGLTDLSIAPHQLSRQIETDEQAQQRLRMEGSAQSKQEMLRLQEEVEIVRKTLETLESNITKLTGELDQDLALKPARQDALKQLAGERVGVFLKLTKLEKDLKEKEKAYSRFLS